MILGHRSGLIVWLNNLKHVRTLRKFGHVHYVSKKMKYAVLYCDSSQLDKIISELASIKYIRDVERSYLQEVKTTYEKKKSFGEKDPVIETVL
ncbi:uncharacterized protein YlbG (UPF0298 family) [Scopulibacillus darangshiensis]|uniref:UPF0298 protein EV207_10516 n=1 Tax=Scopulibacillus darangshiensis TaxID=442528 RepID=A0A4R2P6U8_9BACL|nr:YlbG family protein [Scopulibacillus darangshiensis]TCP30487.1 uncharacterized protein YlbG (UPF0298 family) [Scopulibacillus darangshiensis]